MSDTAGSTYRRRDVLAMGAAAAAAAMGSAARASTFFLPVSGEGSGLSVGFAPLGEGPVGLRAASSVGAVAIPGESLRVTVSGFVDEAGADAAGLGSVRVQVAFPGRARFHAWSFGGSPLRAPSRDVSFTVPHKAMGGLQCAVEVADPAGVTTTHEVELGAYAWGMGLRPGRYVIMVDQGAAPSWGGMTWSADRLTLGGRPVTAPHVMVTVEGPAV